MSIYLLTFLVLVHSPFLALGSACTEACNANYTIGATVVFCSSKRETYTTKVSALFQNAFFSSCYGSCGIAVLHVGACGCPNDCYNSTGHGECIDGSCECNHGWGGADCSLIDCPSSCSNHGICVPHISSAGGDVCKCDHGWTSHDCSVPIPDFFQHHPYGSLPFGELSGLPYYQGDNYEDRHPFFNYSTIATVKIYVSPANLEYLLNPSTIYDAEYMDAELYFDNGVISKASKVTMRVKGFSTRLAVKKSWNIKFPKGSPYKGLKGFSLKSNVGDRQTSVQVLWEAYRAQKVQTYRHAHAQLFINNFFYGLVSLEERIDDAWIQSRFNIDPENFANLWKIGPYNLKYFGDSVEVYQNLTFPLFNGKPFHPLQQEEGNGSWDDIVGLIVALNSTDATSYMQKRFNLKRLIRALVLEVAFMNADSSLSTGNNWYLLDSKEGKQVKWEFIAFDFDSAMIPLESFFAPFLQLPPEKLQAILDALHYTPCSQIPIENVGVENLAEFIMSSNPYVAVNCPNKPLAVALNNVPGANATFTEQLEKFVEKIITDKPGLLEKIREAHYQLVRPIVALDRMYRISDTAVGVSLAHFDAAAATSKKWLADRFSYLTELVDESEK